MATERAESHTAQDPLRPRDRLAFEIAIICALQVESNAVETLFDHVWEEEAQYGKAPGDTNSYTLGRIGKHDVVLAYMPGMGKMASANVAFNFRASFPNIRLGLVVGICGGVPFTHAGDEILLGDVVISTGLVQYDFGRHFPNAFVRKDTLLDNLGRPNPEIRGFLAKLQGRLGQRTLRRRMVTYLGDIAREEGFETSQHPGIEEDKLFQPKYRHKHQDPDSCPICKACTEERHDVCKSAVELSCTALQCSDAFLVDRDRLQKIHRALASGVLAADALQPAVHFGFIASGDWIMKSGLRRDQIAIQEQVIAFEMEGVGAWDIFPTVIIKSACDYADSHKNKKWQRYAATTAAACMKAFLQEWRGTDRIPTMTRLDPRHELNPEREHSHVAAQGRSKSPDDGEIDKADDSQTTSKTLQLAAEVVRLVECTVQINELFRQHRTEDKSYLKGLQTSADELLHLKIFRYRARTEVLRDLAKCSDNLLSQIKNIESLVISIGKIDTQDSSPSEDLAAVFRQCTKLSHELRHYVKSLNSSSRSKPTSTTTTRASTTDFDGTTINEPEGFDSLTWSTSSFDYESSNQSEAFDRFKWPELKLLLGQIRSSLSGHIVLWLKRVIDTEKALPWRGPASLQDDVRTLIRMFQNDNRTIDDVFKDHSTVFNDFWAKNISAHAELVPSSAKPGTKSFSWLSTRKKQDMPVATDEKLRQELDLTLDGLEKKKREKVLQCFQYRQMEDREDDIGTAYGATFKWILEKDDDYSDWDDFPAFLRDQLNTQPYWINGKAGSGKSTLMKYLLNSEKAMEALQAWAGYKTVVIASFFFWNLGTPLQKSMLGFLNTILYQLLRSQPDLIRIVLEEIWPKIDPDESTMTPLSFSEAKRTFHKFLSLPRSFNVCLFVDGIDEFDGDYLEIAAYLRSLCRPDIKVIISSRPLAAFFEIFSDCPSLQLEHLTHDDIKTFVDGNLASHAYMRELMQDQPKEAQELIQEVSIMSSGVFLWVRLVIRSLLEGLRNGDNIADLQGRLQELPADLEDLFQHMLDRLDVRDHKQAVQYFEVFRTAADVVDQPFEAIDMYYAQAGPEECLGEAVRALSMTQAIKKCKQLEKRIRSRCCGLLEFHRPTSLLMSRDSLGHHRRRIHENFDRLLPYARIQYLHRTVAEFLYSPGVWSKLCRQGSSHEFDVYQSLLHVYAARLNSMHYRYQHHEEKTVSDYTNALLFCEQRLELRAGRCHVHIVDIIIPFMKTIWTGPRGLAVQFWRSVNDDQASIISRWSQYQSAFVYAVCFGLIGYVKDKLTRQPLDVRWPKDIPMLWPILLPLLPKKVRPDLETCCAMIGLLLDHGADLHTLYREESFWDALLRTVESGPAKDIPSFRKILLLSRSLNASANAAVEDGNADHVSTSTAAASSAAAGRTVLPLSRRLLLDKATQDSRCVFAAATTAMSTYLPPSPVQTPTRLHKLQSSGATSAGGSTPEYRSLLRLQSLTFSNNDQQRPQRP